MVEYISSNNGKKPLNLDPRTKIMILICVNVVMVGGGLSGTSVFVRPLFGLLPFIMLLSGYKYKPAFLYLAFISFSMFTELFLVNITTGILNLLCIIFSGIISRFIPGIITGYYLVSTTKISELIASMERMRISPKIIIPFAVMIRFFPTVKEESAAISDAMRMRGIRLGGGNPLAMLEYIIVPLLMSTVKIGEELSSAALTRGLGAPVKRTNICKTGFKAPDFAAAMIILPAFLFWSIY
ncbi:MAG: energy-coupling factor transporter transmembrane protein EcfT [Lachnospiraceae bacterium]|nr:energy-coupling factor transporter transmembrane protein EcfT [Lachnospiraceae bacterium]